MSDSTEKIRCFLALPLPESIALELYQNTKKIFFDFPKLRLVPFKNYHITLQFFGDITLSNVDVIKKNMSKIKFDNFDIKIADAGFFPNSQTPKVLWTGFEDETNKIKELYRVIQERLKESEFKKENRQFVPHLTIARLPKMNLEAIKKLQKSALKFNQIISNIPKFNLDKLVLYKSVLSEKGSVYTPLHIITEN